MHYEIDTAALTEKEQFFIFYFCLTSVSAVYAYFAVSHVYFNSAGITINKSADIPHHCGIILQNICI